MMQLVQNVAKDNPADRQNIVEKMFVVILDCILITELAVLFGSIMFRWLFNISFHWAEEVAEIALTALTFIGGAIAYRRKEHMAVRSILEKLPAPWHPVIEAVEGWLIITLASAECVLCVVIFQGQWENKSPVLGLRKSVTFIPMILGMILLGLVALERLVRLPRKTMVTTGLAILAAVLAWLAILGLSGPWYGPGAIWFALIVLVVIVALGVPIGFVLPLVSLVYVYSAHTSTLSVVPSAMQAGIGNFVMLAVPFFILAGYIMTQGGITRPLTEWATALIGHLRGGLLQTVIVCVFIFSGISGAKVADIAAVGTTMKKVLEKDGYEPAEIGAILCASGVMGETVPPSIPMLVLGSITTLSVGALFLAGVLPALVMAICLMTLVYIRARKFKWRPGRRFSWKERGKSTIQAIPALIIPCLLVAGIAGGIATPTEVSSIAVIYGLILSVTLYRGSMDFQSFTKVLSNAGSMAGMILFIIGAGSAFSWVMTAANLPHDLGAYIIGLGSSSTNTFFLLGTIIVLWVMGALLEGLPALLIFAPMLLPIATNLRVDPLQYGIVLIFAMGLGSFSPPVGVCFFVACSIADSTVEKTSHRLWPYLIVLLIGLLIVTFIPWFSLTLPSMMQR
jgi:tripartite ATP-independent transporter DctM subunit